MLESAAERGFAHLPPAFAVARALILRQIAFGNWLGTTMEISEKRGEMPYPWGPGYAMVLGYRGRVNITCKHNNNLSHRPLIIISDINCRIHS